ncbi:MAG: ABC transporter permease, partial [Ardenticatenia bacterium]
MPNDALTMVRQRSSWLLIAGVAALIFVSYGATPAVTTALLASTIRQSTPLILGALSGIFCERSGVINIAIEGIMLAAAMMAVIVASITDSQWLGLLSAIMTGGLMGAFLAILSIRFMVDQIIGGVALNIFALGITSFISQRFLQPIPD